MRRGGISLLLALLLGCSKEAPAPVPAAPAPKQTPPAPPEPALPPLADLKLRDWAEVDEETFLKLPDPATPPVLKWDFAPGRRHGYDFSETLTQRIERTAGDRKMVDQSRERNRGVFEFAAQRDRTALTLMKIQTQEAYLNDKLLVLDPEKKKQGSVSECVVSEEGLTEPIKEKGLADARMYLQSLFALKPGAGDLDPGRITTKPAGFYKVGRYECVRLESEFEVASEKPSQRHLMKGRVVGYFAVAERKFIRASATVASSTRANALAKENIWVTSILDAVTTYRVKFLESP